MLLGILVLLAVLAQVLSVEERSIIILNSPKVSIKGRQKRSERNQPYFEYQGIPYAKPPLGELRFKEPQDIQSANEFRQLEATPVCLQKNYLFSYTPKSHGQEDCLYLNVFVPQECHVSETLCPVLVFFHWGGFFTGRSTTGYLGPEYLMDRKLVLVTANYRLGPFGFLSTLDDWAPGNYALKDQVATLKWVKRNIDRFSGNPDDVTVSGQSSGGASVHYHLMSPMSENLFKKAISQSGVALAVWSYPLNSLQKMVAEQQGQFVGCVNQTNQQLIECLRSVPAETIIETQDDFKTFFGNPVGVYGPVMEVKSLENPLPFITKTPLDYLSNGEVRKVPWLVGFVRNEGVLKAKTTLSTDEVREQLNANFEAILGGPIFSLALSASNQHSLYKNITEFYFSGKEYVDLNDKGFIQGFIDLFSDRAFIYPLYQTLQLHSCLGHSPIYVYQFDYVGAQSYGSVFSNGGKNVSFNWRNCHCDDLLYLFKSPELFPDWVAKPNDQTLRESLLDIWYNFITKGEPFGDRWRPIENSCKRLKDRLHLFRISGDWRRGSTMGTSKGLPKKRMDFWRNVDIFENAEFASQLDSLIKKNKGQ